MIEAPTISNGEELNIMMVCLGRAHNKAACSMIHFDVLFVCVGGSN